MAGLQRMLKIYGSMKVSNDKEQVTWLWDYVSDTPRLKHEMTKEQIDASEKAKWMQIKDGFKKEKE